jgi:uncharacterized protein
MPLEGIRYYLDHLSNFLKKLANRGPLTFVLHGGEPLLLPHSYLISICRMMDEYLAENDIPYNIVVQTNLLNVSDQTLDILEAMKISLGISFDVFGGQRVGLNGKDSHGKVLANIQRLIDRHISFGGICVLHAHNVRDLLRIYRFYNALGIDYRILPIFAHYDPPTRMEHLMLKPEEVVVALQQVTREQFRDITYINVQPLQDYFETAVRHITGTPIPSYNPEIEELILIIDTDGSLYSQGELYVAEGFMGNVFQQPFEEIYRSDKRKKSAELRMLRAEVCRNCEFAHSCSHMHLVESVPSERTYDSEGRLTCDIAKPMIKFMIDEINSSSHTTSLISLYRSQNMTDSL